MALLWLPICANAQKVVKVKANYTYFVPENITLEQAKATALERAKIQAIADEFGTLVSQSNTTFVRTHNEKSSIDFQSLGGSDVKGEWIETTKKPSYRIEYVQNQLCVSVTVEGRIREIINVQTDLLVKVLCNGYTNQHERLEFMEGDDLFLKFQSPIDGFLTVYLVDMVNESAFCLLPYKSSNSISQPITHDQPYIFFSREMTRYKNEVDEYTLTCNGNIERNDLYVIFSTKKYGKANSVTTEELRPRELSWKDFEKWLSKNRTHDNSMQVIHKTITIKKK